MSRARKVLDAFCLPVPTPLPRRRDEAVLDRAETFDLPAGDWLLRGYAWGTGPVVLLAHGWSSRVAHLAAFVEPLLAAGYRVAAAEMPGHGPGRPVESNLLQFEIALLALDGVAGPADGVIAHSGGALATTMALGHGLRARRVALLAPMVRLERSVERFAAAHDLDEAELRAFKDGMVERFGPELWARTSADLLAARLAVPAVLAHDPADQEVPYAEAVLLADAWPGARLIAREGVGHRRLLRQRSIVDRIVAFVTGRQAAPAEPALRQDRAAGRSRP
jgi:pimeloyl-ACP methyl ester carboxylesterase